MLFHEVDLSMNLPNLKTKFVISFLNKISIWYAIEGFYFDIILLHFCNFFIMISQIKTHIDQLICILYPLAITFRGVYRNHWARLSICLSVCLCIFMLTFLLDICIPYLAHGCCLHSWPLNDFDLWPICRC